MGHRFRYFLVHCCGCGTVHLRGFPLVAAHDIGCPIFDTEPARRNVADDLLHVPGIDECTNGLDERLRDHLADSRKPSGGPVLVGGGVPRGRLR